jgi:spermidine synthase
MEKDYYGALLGGLFFAFFALPHLGLTFTPIVLGAINFLVASLLLLFFFRLVQRRKALIVAFTGCCLFLVALVVLAKPIIMYGEQRQYRDKVIYSRQTPYQKIVMTQWKQYYWLFINGQIQFSNFDEEKYHEPLVHPAMQLATSRDQVLILGGGDGLALREVWKYADVNAVTLVDLDPVMTDLAAQHPVLLDINRGSMKEHRLRVVNQDARKFLQDDPNLYGVIIIDLPDPDTIDLMHVYSVSFYRLLAKHLSPGGIMVTQATSPYFARRAFWCIIKTIQEAGFTTLPYHNQIPTMGEWGWVLAVRKTEADSAVLKNRLVNVDLGNTKTRFLNSDAMVAMVHFGKGVLDPEQMSKIEINSQMKPMLHRYYMAGTWEMY